jgi:hypothetical protein
MVWWARIYTRENQRRRNNGRNQKRRRRRVRVVWLFLV